MSAASSRVDRALAALAVLPDELKGAALMGGAPEIRSACEERLARWLGPDIPVRRCLPSIPDGRLAGGLDLAATLAAGRPVAEAGLLADADGGLLVCPMSEGMPARMASIIARAMDLGRIDIERDGVSARAPARFTTLMFWDPGPDNSGPPAALIERIAFILALDGVSPREGLASAWTPLDIAEARAKVRRVTCKDEIAASLLGAGPSLGVMSLRTGRFAIAAARAFAALDGRDVVSERDAIDAGQLVFGPRVIPLPPEAPPPPPAPSEAPADSADISEATSTTEIMVEAIRLAAAVELPALRTSIRQRIYKDVAPGKSGAFAASLRRGNPAPPRPGDPRRGGRLDVIATLRAAAPWQKLRGRRPGDPIRIRLSDFQIKRFRHRGEAVIIFAVDASGSSAINRLAEAKGAIELLLSGCYARRESVALIAFRKESADLLLPPTRSLTRVKRALARLPAGGGTPLASGIAAAEALASAERRKRKAAHIVFVSDGQANVSLTGEPNRIVAAEHARRMAGRLKAAAHNTLFLDISRRPSADAREMSAAMGAVYKPLPLADSRRMSEAIRSLMSV